MKLWSRILENLKRYKRWSKTISSSDLLSEGSNANHEFSFRAADVERSIGGIRLLTLAGIQEMTDKKHDLDHQLNLCKRMMAVGDILPYPWERAVILLRKQRRYTEELELCIYAYEWCKKAEKSWDGYSAKCWLSPRLQRCIARIPKVEKLMKKNL